MTKLERSYNEMNSAINNEIKSIFEGKEVVGKFKTLRYGNVRSDSFDGSYEKLTSAINSGGSMTQKYRADIDILDNATGKVIDHKAGMHIGNVPVYTKKGGMLLDGNTYNLPNQIRLKPGAYTQNKASGDVETMMNVKGGRMMKILSPSGKDDVSIQIGSRQFSPIDIAKVLGAKDKEIDNILGRDVSNHLRKKSNVEHTALNLSQALGLTGPDMNPPHDEVSKTLNEYFSKTILDKSSTKQTLGREIGTVNKDTILLGVKKLIDVKKGLVEEDDKENLMFKRVFPPEKLLGEGIMRELRMNDRTL